MRRCLRSGKALRCATSTTRSRCVATSICPARSVATTSPSPSISTSLPKTRRQPTTLLAQFSGQHSSLHRGYSTPSSASTPQGTIGSGSAGVAEEAAREQEILQAPEHLNDKERQIWEMLMRELQCTSLEVQDISGGCGSMYGIDVVSERFRGLGMLKQQRLVNEVLGEEIKGWHGVQLKTRAPDV
ncbi:bola protein [Cadophora sp. MPI-SDFR-AT-0126]|nr:bola protein [Leotiomycetes sp. MPI-SDFR-AT-0126]